MTYMWGFFQVKEKVWVLKCYQKKAHPQQTPEGMFSADQNSSKSWFILKTSIIKLN